MSRIKENLSSKIIVIGLYDFIRRFRSQFAAQRKLIFFSLFTLILSIFARTLEPWPLKYIFDAILVPTSDTQNIPLVNGFISQGVLISTEALLLILITAIIIFTAVRTILSYVATVGMALAATRTMSVVRSLLFSHLQKLSLTFHQQSKAGDLLTRFTQDIDRLRDVVSMALLPLIANFLTVIAMASIMFWINIELALIVVAVIPFFFLTTLRFSGKIHRIVREQRKNDGAMAASAAESIGAIKLVQALSLNKLLEKTFSKKNNKSLKKGAQAQKLSAMLERNIDLLLAVATALVLWRGVHLVLEATITVGTLMVFITYLAQIFRPMRQTSKYLIKISKALASSERVAHIFDTLPEISERKDAITATGIKGTLRFENVSFSFDKHKNTLKEINLTIAAGKRVAFVGPSGAGKSTILSLALRLYDPQQGRILLDGRDLREYKLDSLRSHISLVLQENILFGISIHDNIAYGQLDASDEDIEMAARLANAHEFISCLPNGYNTVIAEKGETLSGGQRQRIALARAVIRKASIMILDEPTSSLDKINENEVIAALEQCTRNKTTILVSHNIHAVTLFDRIYYLKDGQIKESGTHEELVAIRGAYWKQFIQQAEFHKKDTKNKSTPVSDTA